MADPTEGEVQTMISNVVALYVAARGWGASDSPNLLGMIDTIEQSLEGDYIPEATGGIRAVRSTFSGMLGSVRAIMDPLWMTYGKVKKFPESSPIEIIDRLYTNFIDNTLSVNSREFTFGSVSAGGSNVGTGTILRLYEDKNDLEMEAVTPDTKTFKVIADEHSGSSEHEESFEVRGQHADRDGIEVTGSGQRSSIRAVSARDSARYIENPSFDTLNGSAVDSLTSIPGWTVGSSINNFNLSTTDYRDYPGVGTSRSLKFLTNDCVEQNLNNQSFTNPTISGVLAPMHLQIAYNRSADACDGTLTLYLGSQSVNVSLAAQSGWQVLKLGPGDENWFDVWNEEDPKIKISLTSRSSGTLLVDDVIFAPFVPFDGCWWLPVGGATPFLKEDVFTFADSISSDAKIQRCVAELYGVYLPHNDAAGETWSDPS